MEEEKQEIREELIRIINAVEDFEVLKYLLIFIRGKLKVG